MDWQLVANYFTVKSMDIFTVCGFDWRGSSSSWCWDWLRCFIVTLTGPSIYLFLTFDLETWHILKSVQQKTNALIFLSGNGAILRVFFFFFFFFFFASFVC